MNFSSVNFKRGYTELSRQEEKQQSPVEPPRHRFEATLYVPTGAATSNNNQNSKPTPIKNIDPYRAPKAALAIFLLFCMTAGLQVIFGIENEFISQSSNTHKQYQAKTPYHLESQYHNFTRKEEIRLNRIMKEISRPNLDQMGQPIMVPPELDNLVPIDVPFDKDRDTAFFWHVPRSGGALVKHTAAYCLDLIQASDMGNAIDEQAAELPQLTTIVDTQTGARFVNADTSSPHGLELSTRKGTVISAYPNIGLIATPYLFDGSQKLLDLEHKGRLFVMMRHPIERAESMFWHLKNRPDLGPIVGDSLLNFAKGPVIENNWMTRFLSNKLGGELTVDDEALAREVLRTRALVGLLRKKHESYQRFKDYFGWRVNDAYPEKVVCEDKHLEWGWMASDYKNVAKGSEEWNALKMSNAFDMRLYEYAEKLFEAQGVMMMQNGRMNFALADDLPDDPDYIPIPNIPNEALSYQDMSQLPNTAMTTNNVPFENQMSDNSVIDLIASNLINSNH